MNLLEYQGKELLAARGFAVPESRLARTPEEAEAAAAAMTGGLMVKAQVRSGKRGKAGGIKSADSPAEARAAAERILAMQIGGQPVEAVLIERKITIARELYAGITISPRDRSAVVMLSSQGGMDIEEVAEKHPQALATMLVDNYHPIWMHPFLDLAKRAGFSGEVLPKVADAVQRLVKAAFELDATLAEINPLAITVDGQVVAADAKVVIDDSALFRHRELTKESAVGVGELEQRAREAGLAYVPLAGGTVGTIAGGAGLALATMDTISAHGGRPANFLDVGGGVSQSGMATALRIVLATPGVEGVLINVFGGINNCAVMARGIAEVLDTDGLAVPLVVKMRGHSQEEGWATLEERGVEIIKHGTTGEAVAQLLTKMRAPAEGA